MSRRTGPAPGAAAARRPAWQPPAPDAPTTGSSTAWLVTFTDLVALLLAFFVMLFAMMTLDRAVWNSLQDGFAVDWVQLDPLPEPPTPIATPVMLPAGRARLGTTPEPTGSKRLAKTTGILLVARFAASAAGVEPTTMTSTLLAITSARSASSLSSRVPGKRVSMSRFFPSVYPSSRIPCRNASSPGSEKQPTMTAWKPWVCARRTASASSGTTSAASHADSIDAGPPARLRTSTSTPADARACRKSARRFTSAPPSTVCSIGLVS